MRRKDNERFAAARFERIASRITEKWIESVHITPRYLADTDIPTEFLIAQREAEALLRNFYDYLTSAQAYQLVDFLKRLRVRKKRDAMPMKVAYSVLNIVSKVNRKLFAENRKGKKRKQDKPLANKG